MLAKWSDRVFSAGLAWLLHAGVLRANIALTLFAIAVSLLISSVTIRLSNPSGFSTGRWVITSSIIPAVISPLICWVVLTLAYRLKAAQEALAVAATTDALTGLANRRLFIERGEVEFERSQRHTMPFAVLMLDVDHFKAVNDQNGHASGDRALCAIAKAAASCLRGTDLLARWGGEEFIALLPMTERTGAAQVGERLRHIIGDSRLGLDEIALTVSVGCAVIRADDAGLDSVIARADKRLYQAKAEGRNRVVAGPPGPSPLFAVNQ